MPEPVLIRGLLRERVRLALRRHRTQRAWAAHLGVSPAMVTMVLRGQRDPPRGMLADLGLVKVVIYRDRVEWARNSK